MAKKKINPNEWAGGPVSSAPVLANWGFDMSGLTKTLSKAFGNLNTLAKVTGQLAGAIAPGSLAAGVGQVGAQLGSDAATRKAYESLKSGGAVPTGTSAAELAQAQQMVTEEARTKAYTTMVERTPTVEQRKELETHRGEVEMGVQAAQPPTPFQAYTTPQGQVGTYKFVPDENAPGGFRQVQIAAGTPSRSGTDRGTLSAEAKLRSQQYWYNQAIEMAKSQVGKYVPDPNDPTKSIFVLTDPAKGQAAFNSIAANMLMKFAQDSLIPVEWINNIPDLQAAPAPKTSEVQDLLSHEVFNYTPPEVKTAVQDELNFVGPRSETAGKFGKGYGVGGNY